MNTSLPVWAQWVWWGAALAMLALAVLWALVIFWPYLRRMEKKTDIGLKKHDETARLLADLGVKLTDALTGLASSQKVGIAVQVLTTLVPLFIKAVTSSTETAIEPSKKERRR